MILVTGAAGKTGLHVIGALQDRGAELRAFVRNQTQADEAAEAGAAEAVIGDLESRGDTERAVGGIEAVYHICPNMHPAEIEIGKQIIGACVASKVARFVYHSVFHPQIEAMPHHWNKLRVEEILVGSGLPFTILQPTAYMQNVLGRWAEIKSEGVYRVPYKIETRISMVDLKDVAVCAARVLTEEGFQGGTFELVGPGYFSQVEIAGALAKAFGKPVRAEEIPLAAWREQAEKAGLNAYAVATLYKMFYYYDQFNFMGNSKALESLLGREPTTFEDFLKREIHAGTK
jgi:uncharacterized protein YbjT (DUF2867 family)